MQINVSGHHLNITPALRSYVATKLHRIERHFDHVITAHVVLKVEKERKMAEATVHVNRGNLFADAEHNDMYAAIDRLIDKLDRQVKKHKEKLSAHRG